MTSLLLALLAAAPAAAPLPDLPAPLGMLDRVLEQGKGTDRVVEVTLPGCDHKVPVNVTRFIGGTAYAMQQMVEWLNLTPGLQVFPAGALEDATAAVSSGAHVDQKACKPLGKDVTAAPKLCGGLATDQAWTIRDGKPAALVRWAAASGKDKCLPRLTGVLFDSKGVARIRYDADFGGAASGAMFGDAKCSISFAFDAKNEVFRPTRRGCKGP